LRERYEVKMKKCNIIVAVSLCLISAVSFAGGFGVDSQQTGMNAASQTDASSAVNQLMHTGGDTNSGPQKGTLNSSQIQQIIAQQQKAGNMTSNSPSQQQASNNGNAPSNAPAAPTDNSFGSSSMSQQAFASMIQSMMPLSPAQIKTLRRLFDRSQYAAAAYPGTPPKPTSSSVFVNLSPGATPPIVRLRNGFVTSLVFLDSTGQPWPIQAYDIGDPNSFNIQWNQKGNTIIVQSNTTYKSGNLAVMLKGQDTPVMITLMPGQHAVDYRVDMRVPGFGPNASPTVSNLPDTANPQLLNFLNGVPPNSAKELTVNGGPCQAWLSGDKVYLRTTLTVLSPSWLASMSSPDGTHVYEINRAPVVLASYRGKVVQLTVQGF
jgi:intracellular multiplication protein IcmK